MHLPFLLLFSSKDRRSSGLLYLNKSAKSSSMETHIVLKDDMVHIMRGQVTGELLDELSSWDALRAALPVGTVSGAPKVTVLPTPYQHGCYPTGLVFGVT